MQYDFRTYEVSGLYIAREISRVAKTSVRQKQSTAAALANITRASTTKIKRQRHSVSSE